MVEYQLSHTSQLDAIFASLSDATRRDMLKRVSKRTMNISELAKPYRLSFAAVAKHLSVLERAGLIRKTKQGKENIVALSPQALASANSYLEHYRALWENRLNSLDSYLKSINKKGTR